MWAAIENGAEFYATEADYATELNDTASGARVVKAESNTDADARIPLSPPPPPSAPTLRMTSPLTYLPPSSPPRVSTTRRPRRSTTRRITSYAVPDEDMEVDDEEYEYEEDKSGSAICEPESSLDRWIRHLLVLQQHEQRKHNKHRQLAKRISPKEKVPKVN
jgi:hypothetical protein